MPYSRFESAHLDPDGSLVVSGPLTLAPDEGTDFELVFLGFVLVQGNVMVRGSAATTGQGEWAGTVTGAHAIKPGDAFGTGSALLARHALPAAAAHPASPPLVETLTWSERVRVTSAH